MCATLLCYGSIMYECEAADYVVMIMNLIIIVLRNNDNTDKCLFTFFFVSLTKCSALSFWVDRFVLSLYEEALKIKAESKSKKPQDLIKLDQW